MVEAAKTADIKQKVNYPPENKKIDNKIWYDKECQQMKLALLDASKALQNDPNNSEKRLKVNNKRREYKRTLRTKKISHENKCIENLAQAYPDKKQFWKMLKKIRNAGQGYDSCLIPPTKVISHFENLFKSTRQVEPIVAPNKVGNLDYKIIKEEVQCVLKNANSNAACGLDSIDLFMLQTLNMSQPDILPNLFNYILKSGVFPAEWSTAILVPIHKKGSMLEITNYRGISLLSTIGKIFVSIINNRIVKWTEDNKILSQGQIGFIKGNRTSDAMIVVQNIINKYCHKQGQKIYSCLVDFEKAFDNVPRDLMLTKKLYKLGIKGNILNIINTMYNQDKVCVRVNQKISSPIPITKGVRQGCVLSPTLFNLFLSDFEGMLDPELAHPVQSNGNSIPCIIWADDILLLSETKNGLQYQIKSLSEFCNVNDLSINVNKTKCLCFNKSGKIIRNCFNAGGVQIEDVKEVKYLGFVICANGSPRNGLLDLRDRARKAYYKLKQALGTAFYNNKPLTIKLFDTLIKPILMYASDFWGMSKFNTFEKNPCETLHIEFCKQLLGVSSSVSNIVSMLELGRIPISFHGKKNALNNWLRIMGKKMGNNLVINSVEDSVINELKWADEIKCNLQENGLKLLWDFPGMFKPKSISADRLYAFLEQSFYHKATSLMNKSSKYKLLWAVKKNYLGKPSDYLLQIKDTRHRKALAKLRMGNFNLEIQTGCYRKIDYNDRVCKLCNNGIETEEHFLLKCTSLANLREPFIEKAILYDSSFRRMKNEDLCVNLLRCPDIFCNIISKFIFEAGEKRSKILKAAMDERAGADKETTGY